MNKLIVVLSILLISSCMESKNKIKKQIADAEEELYSSSSTIMDNEKSHKLLDLYISYADKYQDDTASASYLFKAADITINIHRPEQSITLLGRVQRYPLFLKTPLALFLQGFIAETELHDIKQAEEFYKLFLKKYPTNKLADDVQSSLLNLGKSPEELIREFESKDSTRSSLSD